MCKSEWDLWKDNLVEGKNPCYWCQKVGRDGNKDNFHYYGDNKGGYCFSCNNKVVSKDYLEMYVDGGGEQQEEEEEVLQLTKNGKVVEFTQELYREIRENTSVDGRGYRGLDSKVLAKTGVRYEYDEQTGEVARMYYPATEGTFSEGRRGAAALVGYKIRQHPKKFMSIGSVGKGNEFFMQHMFPTHKGFLLITEGEIDSLSAYQMLLTQQDKRKFDEIAVVSPMSGAGSIVQTIRANYEWVMQFKRIIICMDNDEAGKKASDNAIKILPKDKTFVVNLRRKDVGEYLENGDVKGFINDFWGHKPAVIDGVKTSYDGFAEIEDELGLSYLSLPPYMKKLQYNMGGGIKVGGITNIIGATSASKTTHLRNIVYHWVMNTDIKPVIISLEETAATYSLNLLQLHLKKNFFGMSAEQIKEYLNTPEVQEAKEHLTKNENGEPRYYLIDERSGSIEDLEKQVEVLVNSYGASVICWDVLSDALRGDNADKAENHMAFQRIMCKQGVTMVNCLHTRKMPIGKDGKPQEPTEWDALGTGSFIQSAHTNIVIHRDKVAEDVVKRNTTRVVMPKCRGGVTGDAGEWYWDFETLQCYDLEEYLDDNPHLVLTE